MTWLFPYGSEESLHNKQEGPPNPYKLLFFSCLTIDIWYIHHKSIFVKELGIYDATRAQHKNDATNGSTTT